MNSIEVWCCPSCYVVFPMNETAHFCVGLVGRSKEKYTFMIEKGIDDAWEKNR